MAQASPSRARWAGCVDASAELDALILKFVVVGPTGEDTYRPLVERVLRCRAALEKWREEFRGDWRDVHNPS